MPTSGNSYHGYSYSHYSAHQVYSQLWAVGGVEHGETQCKGPGSYPVVISQFAIEHVHL